MTENSSTGRVIVIPDVHLKPRMFTRADEIMRERGIDRAVCLMDIPDDWGKQLNTALYEETYAAAIAFAKAHPASLWCYGNHDASYLWDTWETGYSGKAKWIVQDMLAELRAALPKKDSLAFVQKIGHVLFSHAGITESFVRRHFLVREQKDADLIVNAINVMGVRELWRDDSPIWVRPLYSDSIVRMYREGDFLQVTGHTPVESIRRDGNLISCDVFSARSDGSAIGSCEFLVLDTKTWRWEGVR